MSYKINKYPDGTSYVIIPKEWEDTVQEITFRVNDYGSVIHLAQLCDVLIYNRVKAHIIVPCMIDAQADKRFDEFHSSGLMTIARILDTYVDGYNISMSVFHPHNAEVLEAMITGVEIIDNSEFIREVLDSLDFISRNNREGDLILMSADAGGFKPLIRLCDQIDWRGETFSASKSRSWSKEDGSKFVQQIDRQDFGGKDILIIDDISVYGGTFKGLSKLLKERNCGKLYLAVSHMTMQDLGEDPVTDYFDKVFTSNSKYNSYVGGYRQEGKILSKQPDNLEIIKLFNE